MERHQSSPHAALESCSGVPDRQEPTPLLDQPPTISTYIQSRVLARIPSHPSAITLPTALSDTHGTCYLLLGSFISFGWTISQFRIIGFCVSSISMIGSITGNTSQRPTWLRSRARRGAIAPRNSLPSTSENHAHLATVTVCGRSVSLASYCLRGHRRERRSRLMWVRGRMDLSFRDAFDVSRVNSLVRHCYLCRTHCPRTSACQL
jgi:hypothetical protein